MNKKDNPRNRVNEDVMSVQIQDLIRIHPDVTKKDLLQVLIDFPTQINLVELFLKHQTDIEVLMKSDRDREDKNVYRVKEMLEIIDIVRCHIKMLGTVKEDGSIEVENQFRQIDILENYAVALELGDRKRVLIDDLSSPGKYAKAKDQLAALTVEQRTIAKKLMLILKKRDKNDESG